MLISFVNKLFSSKEKLQAKQIEESQNYASCKLADESSVASLQIAQVQSKIILEQLLE